MTEPIAQGPVDVFVGRLTALDEACYANSAAESELAQLRSIVVACRSSVKFNLLHYEKMARAYGNIGPEGEQIHAVAESEARRLNELLGKIDWLMTPDYGPNNPPRLRKPGESLDEYRAAMGWPTETPNGEVRGASPEGEASASTVVLGMPLNKEIENG